ncbi:MAG: ribose 5-phosphate isomerase B [Christensenellaceae bacterium]|nr:ribose 5-phosphate isomerase B [Christensenellaceae bacterium]
MIAIGCDHVAVDMKNEIIEHLKAKGLEVKDFGTYSTERTHYPIYGLRVANAVVSGECEKGILICGTGVGISLAANKVKGIRAAVCSDCYTAKLSKVHNNSNILAFGARVVGIDLAKMIVDSWLDAEFEGGRHQIRIDMLAAIENGEDIE